MFKRLREKWRFLRWAYAHRDMCGAPTKVDEWTLTPRMIVPEKVTVCKIVAPDDFDRFFIKIDADLNRSITTNIAEQCKMQAVRKPDGSVECSKTFWFAPEVER